ncbi:MAG: hypothetical protein DLM69_11850 [Candidatus Chloroheliales bacterium]|nr:MAG: hypothetical protein DLM69_11850 [Chloroflexota bacterium]
MAEVNERNSSALRQHEQQGDSPASAAERSSDDIEQARLGILQAVERNDISVEEALNLLDELEG